jgi:competence ComEA-like helix-hairpin-helix protein
MQYWKSMNRSQSYPGLIAASLVLAATSLCCIVAQSPPTDQADSLLPDGPGKAILKKSCSQCHTASVIITKPGHTDDDWADILNKMIGRGAVLSDEDGDTLMDYLSTNFGPGWKGKPLAPPGSVGAAAAGGNPGPASGTPPAAPAADATVNVNKASAQELQAALGVTAGEAELIVKHREQFGNYKTWEDVSSVPGVSAEKIKEIQKRLTF